MDGFAQLHSGVRDVHNDQGTQQGAEVSNLDPQTRSFASPRIQFAHPQARS